MKNSFKYIVGLTFIAAFLFIVGCSKDDDLQGPTVTVSNLSPNPVFQGDPVTVTGENLNTVLHVFLNEIEAEFTLDGNTLTFVVPLTADVGENTVTFAMLNKYRVTAPLTVELIPTPVIKTFDAWVPIGGDLVITGTSLDNNTVITIDGVEASISSNTGSELIAVVPDGIPDDLPLELEITTTYGSYRATTPFFARENLLVNGQLNLGQDDEFEGWEKLNGGDGMTAVIGADAFGGGRSMRVVGAAGNPWDSQLASTPVQLEFEGEYTILFYAKAEAEGAIMRVSQSQWDGNGADYFYGPDTELDTDWKIYSFPLTVGKDLPEHRTVFDMGHTNVPFLIDHMALVPGTLDLSGVTGEAPEQLLNGGFEEGMTNWMILNGALEASADAYCGTQSLTATGTGGNPWDVQLASDPMMLEVGAMYELGFWAKAAGPDGVMRASVSRWASGQSDDFFYTPDITVAEDWTYYSYIFEAMPTSTGDFNVVLDFGSTTQTFFVDDVSIKEYRPGETPYANTNFEDGLASWTILNGAAETTDAEAYEGANALTATGVGGNPWDVQLASDAITLEVDQQYKLSFWAKGAGPDGVMRASVSRWASGQSDDFFYTPDITVPEDWTYYAFVFTAQPTSTGNHHVVLDFGASTQTIFLDDLKLYEVNLECQ